MTGAALVLSMLAMIVAGLAALFTHQQAQAAARMLHLSRAPRLQLRVDARPGTNNTLGDLEVRHLEGPDLDGFDVEIVRGGAPGLPVPAFAGTRTTVTREPALRQGERREIEVTLDPTFDEVEAVFRVDCRAGDKHWIVSHRASPDWDWPGPRRVRPGPRRLR